MHIKIKYNKVIPIFRLVLATTLGIMFIVAKQKGVKVEDSMKFVVPMVIILTIPMLFLNYLEITDREIIVRSQFGSVARRYAINNINEISMIDNRIFIDKPNKKEEVKFKKRYASKKGLLELNAKINHLI